MTGVAQHFLLFGAYLKIIKKHRKLYRIERKYMYFQNFSATQFLCEINLGHFEAPNTDMLTVRAALNFEFLRTFDIFKCAIFLKIKTQTAVFDLLSQN